MSTGTPEQRLASAGFELPAAPAPVAAYVPAVIAGGFAYVSGQVPFVDGKLAFTGRVGESVSLEDGVRCAEICALNGLAVLRGAIGELGRVERIVKLGVFVASGEAFADHPKVANGASELMVTAFGEAGRHARAAVGCSSLPLGVPVEVEMVVAVA